MTAIGHTPQGFGFGRALDSKMMAVFGVNLDSIEARKLIEKAKGYTDEECAEYLTRAESMMVGLDATPEKNVKDFARLYKAYDEYVTANNIGAISSRCWPDFFVSFGTPVCGVLSMYIGSQLTGGRSTFFGDPVSMDEGENTITFWHCGMAACDLACKATGAQVGVHPNRKLGPAMDFICEAAEKVTIFRIGRKPDGTFRFFIAGGEALDKEKPFQGSNIIVKTKAAVKDVVYGSVKEVWEPHFVVICGNVEKELEKLAVMYGLEICRY